MRAVTTRREFVRGSVYFSLFVQSPAPRLGRDPVGEATGGSDSLGYPFRQRGTAPRGSLEGQEDTDRNLQRSRSPVACRCGRSTSMATAKRTLKVHGGPSKAVYTYPAEHYESWRQELPGTDLPWGMFGENLTTRGLLEDEVHIGDRFRVGSAELVVTEPPNALLQAGDQIRAAGHHQAIPGEPTQRVLSGGRPRGGGRGRG